MPVGTYTDVNGVPIEYPGNMGIPVTGIPINLPSMSTTPLPYPKSTATTSVDKYLTALLSGIALLTRQGSIPTAAQPQPQYIYQPTYDPNAVASDNRSGNTLGKVEAWVKNNTGVTMLLAGGALLYFMQPSKPQSRRNPSKRRQVRQRR